MWVRVPPGVQKIKWGYRIVAITSGLQPEDRVSITRSSTKKLGN